MPLSNIFDALDQYDSSEKKRKGLNLLPSPLPAARVLCLDVDGTKAVPIVDDDETADNNSAASFVPQTLIQLTPFTDLIV